MPEIFVWREWRELYSALGHEEYNRIIEGITGWKCPEMCPFCGTRCCESGGPTRDHVHCFLCGWDLVVDYPDLSYARDIYMRMLRAFDLNSTQLALEEVGAHLKRRFSDVYFLDWRRFEELIENIFQRHGFRTVLTQRSHDGGADMLLLCNDTNGVFAIV